MDERRVGVEDRVRVLERMMFGYLDENTNAVVPGVLQKLTDVTERFAKVENILKKGGYIIVILLVLEVAKQYGLTEAIAKVFEVIK